MIWGGKANGTEYLFHRFGDSDSVELLGEAEGTWEQTAEDMENGLGSAIRKLYKGRRGEKIYAKYKTKRGKGKRSNY